jgi:hypothetical protein
MTFVAAGIGLKISEVFYNKVLKAGIGFAIDAKVTGNEKYYGDSFEDA